MNTKLRTDAKKKNIFWKDFFKLMNNAVFGKTMENIRKHKDVKLVTTDKINQLVSKPNYHTTKYFSDLSKLIYLGMSMLYISKTLIYKFW